MAGTMKFSKSASFKDVNLKLVGKSITLRKGSSITTLTVLPAKLSLSGSMAVSEKQYGAIYLLVVPSVLKVSASNVDGELNNFVPTVKLMVTPKTIGSR